jgi:hypothetical protein
MTARDAIGAYAILLMIGTPALAQPPATSFEQLIAQGNVPLHQTVYVTDASGTQIKGSLVELQPGSLILLQGSQRLQMTEADVTRIRRKDSVQNGLWLGLGAGVAAAWLAPHVICDLPDQECAAIVAVAIGLPSIAAGAVAGGLIDAAIKKTVFQFDRNRSTVRVEVSPLIGGNRAGALAAIRF